MSLSQLVGRCITDYSDRVLGEKGNHDKAVRFDVTDGYIGINQYVDNREGSALEDRILLSPQQFKALLVFVDRAKHHRRWVR